MSTALPVLWSPAQQAWLQAMGYTVFHDGELAAELDAALQLSVAEAAAASAAMLEVPAAVVRPAPRAPAPLPPMAEAPKRVAPQAPQVPDAPEAELPGQAEARASSARSASPIGTRQPSVRLPDRLQMALLRASGCNPNDPSTQALMDSWPLQQLRRDPAAKRALWPQLRALRRKARG